MEDNLTVQRGGCLPLEGQWTDEGGPIDCTGLEMTVHAPSDPALADIQGTFDWLDRAQGRWTGEITSAISEALPEGLASHFRIRLAGVSGCPIMTPAIWVNVE